MRLKRDHYETKWDLKYTFYFNRDLKVVLRDLVLLRAYSNPESIRNNYIFLIFYIFICFLVSVVNFYIVILTITINTYKKTSNNDCTNVNPFFLRALKVKAVLSMFSPIVRISPPLSQMCPDMEHDVRKGHRAKSQGILNRLKDTIRYLCRKTLRKRTYFHTNNLRSHYVNFQCFVLWNGFLFLRHS